MKLKVVFAALAVASAGSAMATPLATAVPPGGNLGVLSPIQANFADVSTAAPFTDSFSFTLGGNSIVTGSLATLFGGVDISAVSFDGKGVSLASIPTGLGFTSAVLSAGAHTLSIKGTFSGAFNAYQGSVYATPAVPEPASLALTLAGIGVVSTVVRRRNKKN